MFETQRTAAGLASLGPQLKDGVLGPEVGLVTLTIGGNDLGFAKVLAHCMTKLDCMDDEFDDQFDDGVKSGLTLREWAEQRLTELSLPVEKLFATLRREAPNARIIVLGYPNLFLTTLGGGVSVADSDCIVQALFIGITESSGMLNMESAYNDMLERAAYAAGIDFISTAPTFLRHEPCGGGEPRWMDFIVPGGGESGRLDPGSMHPNRNGHYILARLISCFLSIPLSAETYDPDRLKDCALYGDAPVP
jgi:hypothetical protein